MKNGSIPPSLLYDDIHFTAAGYEVIGHIVYERLLTLGYLDEVTDETYLYVEQWR